MGQQVAQLHDRYMMMMVVVMMMIMMMMAMMMVVVMMMMMMTMYEGQQRNVILEVKILRGFFVCRTAIFISCINFH